MATIPGSSNPEILNGTNGADSIDALGGDDTIFALDGNDTISAGDGNDRVEAGSGDDTVSGGGGDDSIHAGYGNDTIDGNHGNDTILGWFGNDSLLGGAGDDSIYGHSDNDTIEGGTGNDTIDGGLGLDLVRGGMGDDSIFGANNFDTLYGDVGNDYINGGLDADTIFGGSGSDTIYGESGDDNITGNTGSDYIDGGIGNDLLEGGFGGALSIEPENDTIVGGEGNDTINANVGDDSITGDAGRDWIQAGVGNDTVYGGADNDVIYGNEDDDQLYGGLGADTIQGGPGNDHVAGEAGDDLLRGDNGVGSSTMPGTDTLDGGDGNDTLQGGYGFDSLSGGIGRDLLDGGGDADTMIGGEGFDTFIAGNGDMITDFNTAAGQNFNDDSQTNNDFVDLSGYYNDANLALINAARAANNLPAYGNPLAWLRGDQSDGVLNDLAGQTVNGTTLPEFTFTIQNGGAAVDGQNLTYDNTNVCCFAADVLIATVTDATKAGALAVGDLVQTRDAGPQAIRWIGKRTFSAQDLAANPNLQPIRIRKGALGLGLPQADLIVSPQHRILVRSNIAQKMFGTREVLVAAKQLCQLDGIDVAEDITEVTYVHFLFDHHQIVLANGAEAESLHTGEEALKSVGPAAAEEIFAIFPELRSGGERPSARILTSGRLGRKLVVRHAQNRKPLVM